MNFEEFYKKRIQGGGGDYELSGLLLQYEYDDFINLLNLEIDDPLNALTVSYKKLEYSQLNRDDYQELKDATTETRENLYKEFLELESNKLNNKQEEFKFPLKEILNGNFDTLDKDKLSIELKKKYRVDDLPEMCYDIYINPNNGFTYPVYYDYTTHNKGWIIFCEKVLKVLSENLNIKLNYRLPLLLFDRDLMGKDPDDGTDSLVNAKRILEGKKNPYHNRREARKTVGSIDEYGNKQFKKYKLTIASWTHLWLYAQCFNTYREQSRQTGKTYDITGDAGDELAFAYDNMKMLVFHFNETEAKKVRNDMIVASNNIPEYMKLHKIEKRTKKGEVYYKVGEEVSSSGSKEFRNEKLNNSIFISAVGKTEEQGSLTGRGKTLQFVIGDEINFIVNISSVFQGVMNATNTAFFIANKNNKRHGIHLTSTSGKLNKQHGRLMYNMIFNEMVKFQLFLFSYTYSELKEYLENNGIKHFFTIMYTYDQLGLGEEWLKKMRAANDKENFQIDILSQWLATDEGSVISKEHLNRLNALMKLKVVKNHILNKKWVFKYFPSLENDSFEDMISKLKAISIGVDLAGGTLNDSCVFYGIDLLTGNKILLFKNNQISVPDCAALYISFINLIKKINPELNVISVVELNNQGLSFVPLVTKDPVTESTLFHQLIYFDKSKANPLLKSYQRRSKKPNDDFYISYGSTVNKTLRDFMTKDMLKYELVDKYPQMCLSEEMIAECMTLVEKNGKIQAAPDSHDDVLMAGLHAASVIFYDPYRELLKKRFGFTIDFFRYNPSPLTSHTIAYDVLDTERVYNELEGRVRWEVINKLHVCGKYYEELIVYKYKDGQEIKLTDLEVTKECKVNKDLNKVYLSLKVISLDDLYAYDNNRLNNQNNDSLIGYRKKIDYYDMNLKMY